MVYLKALACIVFSVSLYAQSSNSENNETVPFQENHLLQIIEPKKYDIGSIEKKLLVIETTLKEREKDSESTQDGILIGQILIGGFGIILTCIGLFLVFLGLNTKSEIEKKSNAITVKAEETINSLEEAIMINQRRIIEEEVSKLKELLLSEILEKLKIDKQKEEYEQMRKKLLEAEEKIEALNEGVKANV